MRSPKRMVKRALRGVFEIGQKFGLDILPRHYYSEIPDIAELKKTTAWRKPYSMAGIRGVEIDKQFAFVEQCCPPDLVREQKNAAVYDNACKANGTPGFGPVEADFLYCFFRTHKPAHVIQIGCGVSTAVIQSAMQNSGYSADLRCVDPNPTVFLQREAEAGRIRLVRQKAEELPLDFFLDLGPEDVFFVDSTHTLKPGSEVSRVILEVLPRLRPGVWVHFHDINFPYDYSRQLLTESIFFPHESVLLQAFLTQNPHYELKVALSMLHHADPRRLGAFLPNYRPSAMREGLEVSEGHFPSSVYLTVTDAQ